MQAITPALAALLKDHFQAGASGFRGRIEVDEPTSDGAVTLVQWAIADYSADLVFGSPVTPGNLLVGMVENNDRGDPGVAPAGWTQVGSSNVEAHPAFGGTGYLFYRIAEAGDTGFVNGGYAVIGAEFAGVDTSAGIVTAGLSASSDNNSATISLSSSPGQAALIVGAVMTRLTGDGKITPDAGVNLVPPLPTALPTNNVPHDNPGMLWAEVPSTGGTLSGVMSGSTTDGYWWGMQIAAFVPVGRASYPPKRISIDKSLRMTADQATVEFANEDLPLGWGPDSLFPTNSRLRAYQWFGDADNEVCTFTGLIDAVTDSRDPLTTAVTCRDMMALLLDQTFGATAPQGADEDGAVRTEANGVYLSREVSYIVADILDRAGWPSADRAITPTSYVLDEYVIPDGTSWAEAIVGEAVLTGLVGYDAWADEAGVFHFAPTFTAGALTEPGTPAYTFQSGVDILSLQDATDQYDLRTRVKVRGPLTTQVLTDTWRELWRTRKISKPVGIWYDPSDSANIRVLDRGTKRLYKLRQSDRVVLSSVNIGAVITYPLGVSGDPSDSTIYWILNGPWLWGSGSVSQMVKVRKSDNHVLARYNLDTDHWSSIKVSGSYIYVANLTDDKVYRRSKTTGAAVDSFRHTYNSNLQSNPSGVMIDGTTINVFWSNSGTTARFLQCAESAPGTVTKVVKTAGTALVGGEMDTTTHTECWGGSDSLGLVAKFTLVAVEDVTTEVYAEVVDIDLEDELGALAQSEVRVHDAHSGDPVHAFEVRRDTLDVTVVTSLAQATETAMRRLDKLSQRRRVLDVGIVGNPALQKTDFVRVEDPVTGIAEDWSIDTYRSDMAADGTYLGTLALIPVETPDDDVTDDGDATE